MHACMCVCACVCACVRVCVCACVIIGYVRPSLNCAVRPVSFSAFGTGGPAGGRGTVGLAGGSKGCCMAPTVTVGMPVSGSEPPLGAETCETTGECAALCRSSRSIVFIQSLTRIDCCHVRPFAQAMTEEQMTKDKDQKNRGSKARTKTNTKSADHMDQRMLASKNAQLHQKTSDSTVAPGCVDASGGAAILSYPRVILELSLSYP